MTITVQNRTQTELVLLKVDPATGKTTPLLDREGRRLGEPPPRRPALAGRRLIPLAERRRKTGRNWNIGTRTALCATSWSRRRSAFRNCWTSIRRLGRFIYRASTESDRIRFSTVAPLESGKVDAA